MSIIAMNYMINAYTHHFTYILHSLPYCVLGHIAFQILELFVSVFIVTLLVIHHMLIPIISQANSVSTTVFFHSTSSVQIEPSFLLVKAQEFYANGLAASTLSTYSAGQIRFTNFCKELKVTALPATEATLILFATYLATINISHTTIKVYLAGVRYMHVSVGLFSFFDKQLTPRLQLTLKGIQKNQTVTQPPRIHLPPTYGEH